MISAMKRRTLIIGGLGLGGMLGAGWLGWRESSRRAPQANRSLRPGAAPNAVVEPQPESFFAAKLPDLQGNEQAMAQWRGQPLVINFWATWCPPCVKEIPDLNRLAAKHQNAQFVGVAIDTADNVAQFIQKIPLEYPLVLAGHQGIELVRALGNSAGGLPFTVLIRADGTVQEVIMGMVEAESLDRQIGQLVTSSAV
jgi:thiol-disulfide isomerase/thioredoxin